MEVGKYSRGDWLTVQDVTTGDLLTIMDEGHEVDDNFNPGKKVLEITVKLPDGNELTMKPNRPSVASLIEAWGSDSANWVGKQAIVDIQQKVVNGEDRDVIYLIPNDEVDPDPKPPVAPTAPASMPEIKDEDIPVADPANDIKKK